MDYQRCPTRRVITPGSTTNPDSTAWRSGGTHPGPASTWWWPGGIPRSRSLPTCGRRNTVDPMTGFPPTPLARAAPVCTDSSESPV